MPQPDPDAGLSPPPSSYPPLTPPPAGPPPGGPEFEPSWGIVYAVIGWLMGLAGSVVTVGVVMLVTGENVEDVSLGWVAVAQSGLWVGLLVMPLLVSRTKGGGMVSVFGLRLKPRDVVTGGGVGLVTQLVAVPLVYIPILYFIDRDADVGEVAREMTDRADGFFGILMLILIVGIAAPIVEEIFYRGLLQRSLERRFGPVPGLLATSVIFGLSHFQPLQFPALVLAGLVFGLLAQRSGRLGPAIAAHLVFNMVAVVSLVWLT